MIHCARQLARRLQQDHGVPDRAYRIAELVRKHGEQLGSAHRIDLECGLMREH
jgi:hypothetical protein